MPLKNTTAQILVNIILEGINFLEMNLKSMVEQSVGKERVPGTILSIQRTV